MINLLISPKKKEKKNLLVSLNWMIPAFNRVGPLSGSSSDLIQNILPTVFSPSQLTMHFYV